MRETAPAVNTEAQQSSAPQRFLATVKHVAHLVFVYGTLMKGELHHTTIAHARFVRMTATEAGYDLVQIDYYPALIAGGRHRVPGELYEVDDQTLVRLDRLEEVPDYYERLTITLDDGSAAFAYVMPRARAAHGKLIRSGDFRAR